MPPEARQPSARQPTANSQRRTAISQRQSQTAISHRPDSQTAISHQPAPDSHQPAPSAGPPSAGPPSAGPQKARDVETFRAFALISSQMRSRAHQAMLAEVRLRAILRTFRSLRILRTLWPFRTLGATLLSLGHIL